MATFGYANLPVPGGGDAPVAPGDLAELATAIDPHLWQHATDQADRDTLYSTAPAMTVVVALNGSTWVKVSDSSNTWITVWEPLADWQPLTLASGYEAGQTTPQGRIDRGQVYLRGRIERTDSGLLPVAGVKIGEVPDEFIPEQIASFAGGASLTGDAMTAVGRVEVFSHDQDGNFLGSAGSIIWYSQDGMQDSGTPGVVWADISGSYWLD